jgi:hypothetical protein
MKIYDFNILTVAVLAAVAILSAIVVVVLIQQVSANADTNFRFDQNNQKDIVALQAVITWAH